MKENLTVKDYLSHLCRHPIPEIMDDECIAALSSVQAQYGETVTHGAGLEVRLGEEARYVDYIMNIDTDEVPGVESIWYEIDYDEFRKAYLKGGSISPCLFANTGYDPEDKAGWDEFLPSFLGAERAEKLRPPFDHVLKRLPEGACIKQIGTMTGRGELSIMRLVILFCSWESIPEGLINIGWQGDADKLRSAMEPWKETKKIAVNIDLGADGVLPKIGIEVFSRWRHPVLADKFIARLEEAGLCLASKGEALRRWIRISPDGDPFIQTLISYFKLNYRDGKITEAKAYLEQSPYIHHHYFEAYEKPVRLDIELVHEKTELPVEAALMIIRQCSENRIRRVRLYGCEQYGHPERLLPALKDNGITAQIVLVSQVDQKKLDQMSGPWNPEFIVEVGSPAKEAAGFENLSLLQKLKISPVSARWHMCAENAGELEALAGRVEKLGASELIVTGMCAGGSGHMALQRKDLEKAALFIEGYESSHGMTITVDSCFSPLRAFMGGEDAKRNPNRGITSGCEAGRSFMAVRADGKYTPCLRLKTAGEDTEPDRYWKQLSMPGSLHKAEKNISCQSCLYGRRCRPCPAMAEQKAICPLA